MLNASPGKKSHIQRRIAYFVTSHGFGHASRACAVMQSMLDKDPTIGFEVFTHTPEWFFKNSLCSGFGYHYLDADVGMVQKNPFQEDVDATLRQLSKKLPFYPGDVESTAAALNHLKCEMVLCDIAPMGIVVAAAAGIPSVLIENFTWDWIYSGYPSRSRQFKPYIAYLQGLFDNATCHIKAEPYCQAGNPDFVVAPVSRKPRTGADVIRGRLGVPDDTKLVILTMGGVRSRKDYAEGLERLVGIHFVVPGVDTPRSRYANVTYLPSRSDFFHPDLIGAADAVVGKAGYSTVAEVYDAGKPFGYINRSTFRESSALVRFIQDHLDCVHIPNQALFNEGWFDKIAQLLAMPAKTRKRENGADQIAAIVLERLPA